MDEVLKFIESQRAQGLDDQQIRQTLLRNGWDIGSVEKAFVQIGPAQPVMAKPVQQPAVEQPRPQLTYKQPPAQPASPQSPATPAQPVQQPAYRQPPLQQVQPPQLPQQPQQSLPQNQPATPNQGPLSILSRITQSEKTKNSWQLLMLAGVAVAIFGGFMLYRTLTAQKTGEQLLNSPPSGYSVVSGQGYDILVPDDWFASSSNDNVAGLLRYTTIEIGETPPSDDYVALTVYSEASTKSPAQVIDEEIERSGERGNEVMIIFDDPSEVNNNPARKLEAFIEQDEAAGGNLHTLLLAVKYEGRIYIASIVGNESIWDQYADQAATIIDSFVPFGEEDISNNGELDAQSLSRVINKRKTHLGKLVAWTEQYAANNSGQYPKSASTVAQDLASSIESDEDFQDPVQKQPYAFTADDPAVGVIQYLTSHSCDGENAKPQSSQRRILFRTLLDDGNFYCIDNA